MKPIDVTRPKQANQCNTDCWIIPECVSMIATFVHNSITHLSVVSLASVLTNRLVLNLKQAGNSNMQHEGSLPSLAFATNSFVGNLGAPFRVNDGDGEEEELHDLGINEHELQELNHEGQAALIVEDA